MKRFFRYYGYGLLFAFFPAIITRLCLLSGDLGAIGGSGQQIGHLMMGIANIFTMVIFHHLWLIFMTSNFDAMFVGFFIFSFMWVWVTSELEDIKETSPYYKSIYTEMMKSPVFWLNVILGVGATCVPIYAFFKFKQFFGGHPMYDITY